jgi:hypothetical protein
MYRYRYINFNKKGGVSESVPTKFPDPDEAKQSGSIIRLGKKFVPSGAQNKTSKPVLQIRDVLSQIQDPTIAPSWIRIPDPTYFCIKAINKSRDKRIPDPRGKKAPDPGSATMIESDDDKNKTSIWQNFSDLCHCLLHPFLFKMVVEKAFSNS